MKTAESRDTTRKFMFSVNLLAFQRTKQRIGKQMKVHLTGGGTRELCSLPREFRTPVPKYVVNAVNIVKA